MARNRIIKPEFWADAKVGRLSLGARLLYIGMWNFADDYGTISASPRRMLGDVFENDESITLDQVTGWLAEIESEGMIARYTAKEKDWYEIPKFSAHQKGFHKSDRRNPLPEHIPDECNSKKDACDLHATHMPNVNVNDNGNGNGNTVGAIAPPRPTEKPLTTHQQAYIPLFAQITAVFDEPDLKPTTKRLKVLSEATHNKDIGGFPKILEAANNLARSPAPDSIKRYDWLLNGFDYAERITEFLTQKNNGSSKKREYTKVPDDWDPGYADPATTP